MNPLLTKIAGAITGGGDGKLISAVGSMVDNLTISKEEKEQFKIEFARLEKEEKEKLAQLAIDKLNAETEQLKVYAADANSAREMQREALKQDDKFSKRFVYYFTIHWSVFACAYLAAITFVDIPADNIRIVDTILGFLLGTAISMMFGFFFGSSLASRQRSEQLTSAVADKLKKP